MGDVLTAELDGAGNERLQAGQAVDELRLAVAVDAGKADDLAAADLERNVLDGIVLVELGGHGHALHLEHDLAKLGRLLVHMEADAAADHHGGQLLRRGAGGLDRADVLALAQHRAAVGDRHNLGELVGDEKNALALGGEVAHDLHELVDLLRGEDGGRLVEDQDLVFAVEHLEDLGALLHTDGDVLNERVGVNVQAVLLAQGEDLFAGLGLLQKAALRGLHAHDDVVEHGEAFHQLEVLVDHADAERVGIVRVLDGHDLAVLLDGALLGLVQTEEHAHERGFACAVFAQQGMDLALFELKRNVVVGDNTGESFGDVEHLNGIR